MTLIYHFVGINQHFICILWAKYEFFMSRQSSALKDIKLQPTQWGGFVCTDKYLCCPNCSVTGFPSLRNTFYESNTGFMFVWIVRSLRVAWRPNGGSAPRGCVFIQTELCWLSRNANAPSAEEPDRRQDFCQEVVEFKQLLEFIFTLDNPDIVVSHGSASMFQTHRHLLSAEIWWYQGC